jgi:ribosome-binding protein aMBF1 (putative translation factor)
MPAMRSEKRKRLQAAGWTVGDAKQFLELTEEESRLIEMKLALGATLRSNRKKYGLTQVQLAAMMESSQSRVAKMEAGDPSVSLDLLVRALLVLGMSGRQVGDSLSSE